jgi:fermentation-respiration switch protein FrsA (DUF1100 family)
VKLFLRIVAVAAALLVVAYLAVVAYMYVNQRALQYDADGEVTLIGDAGLTAQEVAIPAGDASINGWYTPPAEGHPLIVYFKGNSGSFTGEHERYAQWVADGYGFLAFDYRGFPTSPGEISEAGILEDALAAFDWAAEQGYPLVLWGRSLGSGPATYVASEREAEALLLETPFLSAVTVAAERYPLLPVGWVMLDQFRSNEWIAEVEEPVFVAHGTQDLTIDVSNGERLYELAPNPYELWIEDGADHGDLWDRGIWVRAEDFFTTAAQSSAE